MVCIGRKLLSCVCSVALAASMAPAIPVLADELEVSASVSVQGGWTLDYKAIDGEVAITGYEARSSAADLTIPAEVNGMPVTTLPRRHSMVATSLARLFSLIAL